MSLLANIRQRQQTWARRVLGLFAVVLLNMVLQPCAMAFDDTSDHGCPKCPPALSGEISSHITNEADQRDLGASPCATNVSQCTLVDDVNYDGRPVKIKDAPTDVPVGIALTIADIPSQNNSSARLVVGDQSYLPGGPPPLNILYCVYQI